MKKKIILLVEDNYLDVKSVKKELSKLKTAHTLHVVHNGTDALDVLNGNTVNQQKIIPDIILLDMNMPKMTGIEFLRVIKNYYSFNNIKVFIMITSQEDYDKIADEKLEISGYILKPLDFGNITLADATSILRDELKGD